MASIPRIEDFCIDTSASRLSKRPLPVAPDGEYSPEERTRSSERLARLVELIKRIKRKEPCAMPNQEPQIQQLFTNLCRLSLLPPGLHAAQRTTDTVITQLNSTMPHSPPIVSIGVAHTFRQADGRGNNLLHPNIGRADTPYARSVPRKSTVSASSLPDPGIIFDTLMRARDRQDHPSGVSSLAFAFVSLIAHSLFHTDAADWSINMTSSYLDLSPLYGANQHTQNLVRDKHRGRGLLHPDTFADERLVLVPPAATALLVLFNRNHNYIAEMLLKINERGRWSDPPTANPKLTAQQDEEIFQTARLVNCGHFRSIVVNDYAVGLLGLPSEYLPASIDHIQNTYLAGAEHVMLSMLDDPPRVFKRKQVKIVEKGQGKQSSVELNLLYRWHSATSAHDEEWTEDLFEMVLRKKSLDSVTLRDFGDAFGRILTSVHTQPSRRTFGRLKRSADGKFSDDDLATILQDATESPAGSAFRARGIPGVLRLVEMLGIVQARQWGVCTLNEFRQYLGLRKFKSFEEWNKDEGVVVSRSFLRCSTKADRLELYVGLHCEQPIPSKSGVRLACGSTMMRAILGDTIALIWNDRYHTTDFTRMSTGIQTPLPVLNFGFAASNLTAWGYHDCQSDMRNGAFGAQIPKLLMRHLPRHYSFNSVHACFPFFTPRRSEQSLAAQGLASQYTFRRLSPAPKPRILSTRTAIHYVLADPHRFPPIHTNGLGGRWGFFPGFDDLTKPDPDRAWLMHTLFPSQESLEECLDWYRDSLLRNLKERSWRYDGVLGNYVDVVKGVINATTVHWVADHLCDLELKTKDHPRGLYTEQEIYAMLTILSMYSTVENEFLENAFHLRWASGHVGVLLQALTSKSVLDMSLKVGQIARLFLTPESDSVGSQAQKPCHAFFNRLWESGRPTNQLVALIIRLAVTSVKYARVAVDVVAFYMDDERKHARRQIVKLLQSGVDYPRCDDILLDYVREAMRHHPPCSGVWRDVAPDVMTPQDVGAPLMKVRSGDRLWINLKAPGLDARLSSSLSGAAKLIPLQPSHLPSPDPPPPSGSGTRKRETCPWVSYTERMIVEILRVVFSLKNVRPAPGREGKLAAFKYVFNETETNIYITADGNTSRWPGSMYLVYDD
ncbi:Heme peroxidase [Mycena venus]|uniref:Heme peroxidase n=1 Tax=Mycena venus TaxID=2733690 RepID=A0A8H7CHN4_9AGAR|nr:Heme peroxidase [Mycena venus]